jgi:hypothetical protein
VGIGKAKIPLRFAIGLSMAIAVLNLIKTLVILKFEAMSVDLSLWQYIKCGPCLYCTPLYVSWCSTTHSNDTSVPWAWARPSSLFGSRLGSQWQSQC